MAVPERGRKPPRPQTGTAAVRALRLARDRLERTLTEGAGDREAGDGLEHAGLVDCGDRQRARDYEELRKELEQCQVGVAGNESETHNGTHRQRI